MNLVQKAKTGVSNFRLYWNTPMPHRYMPFKEIAAYSFGGIGAYFLITLGTQLAVSTTNMIVGGAIGVEAWHMYILYLISTLVNIPLTGIRANMVDNTRGKGGKYRPYLLSMGLPTAIISIAYVWFPYEKMDAIFTDQMFGYDGGYVVTCAMVLLFNLLLQFFFNFFNDAYTNLIHVLSPNTQERTDVLAVKSVVYSLAPSIVNIVLPLIAQFAANDNLYDIRVYRIAYPVFAIIGILLTIVVYANTKEKIVQARTHTIQISFMDALKAVAKNKYFWVISLAGWLGFLESAYGNILSWSYNYGHTATGWQFSLINTLTGNASLWGMLLAPFCIRKWGKKKVLIGVNTANVICILMMLIDMRNIWWLFVCVYFNWLVGAFEQITTPAIQADIRDYQQYRTGERIDGMFAMVLTIGNVVTLLTSSVLPMVQRHYGVYEGNGYEKAYDILDVNNGDPDLLYRLMGALIIMAAVGAFLNMVPYLFYNFDEKKQQSVVRVLKVRALFEDYGNGALSDGSLVEAIDTIRYARETAALAPKEISKNDYKSVKGKAEHKAAKKAYRDANKLNVEIEISKFVCEELDKFSSAVMQRELAESKAIYAKGLAGLTQLQMADIKTELSVAKCLPTGTKEEKEYRKFAIEVAHKKKSARKAIDKYFSGEEEFVQPDFSVLEGCFAEEDACDEKLKSLFAELRLAKKSKDKARCADLKQEIKSCQAQQKNAQKKSKAEMDRHARFNRAAKPYLDAEKLIKQERNYAHFEEIAAMYDDAKARYEKELAEAAAEAKRLKDEEAAMTAKLKAEKAAKKAAKKAGKKQ